MIIRSLSPEPYPDSQCACRRSDKALKSLCLVSKRFHCLAEPHLYRVFSHDDRGLVDWRHRGLIHRLRPFLHRILARPDLAAKVEIMESSDRGWVEEEIDDDEDSDRDRDEDSEETGRSGSKAELVERRDDAHPFVTAAKRVEIQDKELFVEDVRKGKIDAECALLASLIPKLADLKIIHPDHLRDSWLCKLMDKAASTEKPDRQLKSLRRAVFEPVDESWRMEEPDPEDLPVCCFNIADVQPLLALPPLRELYGCSAVSYEPSPLPSSRKTNNVEKIEFLKSKIETSDLARIIAPCTRLKSFSVAFGDLGGELGSHFNFD